MAADPGSTRPSLSGACLGDDGVGLRWEKPAITQDQNAVDYYFSIFVEAGPARPGIAVHVAAALPALQGILRRGLVDDLDQQTCRVAPQHHVDPVRQAAYCAANKKNIKHPALRPGRQRESRQPQPASSAPSPCAVDQVHDIAAAILQTLTLASRRADIDNPKVTGCSSSIGKDVAKPSGLRTSFAGSSNKKLEAMAKQALVAGEIEPVVIVEALFKLAARGDGIPLHLALVL
ncbi:hypothetical protein MHUMG1_05077 [Metarhizium humberi]|uniref:Uncharacterized protein n=1 Tax=Metarhizium humberi TaxID=2596975 RepID=A0A9P8MCI7_9HYPO|nr:hypothetical protein MHUMG1_05077 [Metarhizium humberi]